MKKLSLILIIALLLAASGCAPRKSAQGASLFAMDTYCTIEAHGGDAAAAVEAAEAELLRLEKLFSIGDPGSDVRRILMARGAPVEVSADTAALIRKAGEVSAMTDGAFDITIEPVVRLWGFYDETQRVPARAALMEALALTDYTRVTLDGLTLRMGEGQAVDLGGIAKGYASDRMANILRAHGVDGALISLGGNVYALGERPGGGAWRVALRDPRDENAVLGVIAASDRAVITAGSYQRRFEAGGHSYHHIIDPASGYPAESGLLSVTVIMEDGAAADALSTALFVMGAERARAFWKDAGGFDMILVTEDGGILHTPGAGFSPVDDCRYFVDYVE